MKVLQICQDYHYTKLYRNLFNELNDNGVSNIVYSPLHIKEEKTIINDGKDIIYSLPSFQGYQRFFFYNKQRSLLNTLENNINVNEVDIIHAHTLFTSGNLAYELKKKYNKKYIVAVRNTDVNAFFKYRKNLCSKGIEIMVNAEKVIFISPRYKEFVLNKYVPQKLKAEIEAKCLVIPNGIDNFWIDNRKSKMREESKKISFIQVGRLMKNKNLDATLKIVKNLREQGYDASLDIVGDGPTREQVERWSKEYSEFIKYHGQLNKEEILKLYGKSDIFIMPSKGETFGLVYIEAISQGVPIIYSSGEGVDGYFKELEVGAAINYNDINESTKLILDIIKDYNNISIRGKEACVDFTWSKIGIEYNSIYREINNEAL